ncbi:hypothetical protein [Roseateles noduli]|uniref:hypothetical protein n=1 Tax=Roseateles noduli TaxID=2052484 RepID=UPI003D65DF3E
MRIDARPVSLTFDPVDLPPAAAPAPTSDPPRSRLSGLRQAKAESGTRARLMRSDAFRRATPPPRRVAAAATPDSARGGPLSSLRPQPQTTSGFYEKRAMPTDLPSLERLTCNAALARFPYERDDAQLPPGWSPCEALAVKLRTALGLRSSGVEHADGTLVDRGTGLTAVVLQHPETREVVLSFGGTTAGKKTGETVLERSRPGQNFGSTMAQWGANLKAGAGHLPESYRQAADLLLETQNHLQQPSELKGFAVRVVGHSKGANEAIFASLRAQNPVPVTAFCPPHLSDGLVHRLPPRNLARATELVESFSPRGDVVSALRSLLPNVHGLGIGHHFDGIPGKGTIHVHDRFDEHVTHYCDATRTSRSHG